MNFRWVAYSLLALLLIAGCGEQGERRQNGAAGTETQKTVTASAIGCASCHPFELDEAHAFACVRCHGGDEKASEQATAHAGMDPKPAHPERMKTTCGGCHPVAHTIGESIHFTLHDEVNTVRRAFGATVDLPSAAAIPTTGEEGDPLALADDLLRRRCLRCHVGYEGDSYGATRRGTGCAACHLAYEDGQLISHRFIKRPADRQCQSCHYGNFVGADYHGRFERDFGWEYRTPFDETGQPARPFGVEFHQLAPDIHQKAGMTCVDCHPGSELKTARIARPGDDKCRLCHDPEWRGEDFLPAVRREGGTVSVVLPDGRILPTPNLRHPAHSQHAGQASCVVCHARWSFQDEDTHLIRLDVMDYGPWDELTVQGSSEVERQLEDVLGGRGGWAMPVMRDKFTGEPRLGLWQQGYWQRRWEKLAFCRDAAGVLHVCRPLVDLSLSQVNHDGRVAVDAERAGAVSRMLPYQPHTLGRAGAFWRQRLISGGEKD